MLQPHQHAPQFLRTMADGTIKQVNPFSGTEVWTVPGRANRPLGLARPEPRPLDPAEHDRHCAFCAGRYLETPPEKARVVRGAGGSFETLAGLGAEHLFDTVAAFRRVPNLFEILSYDYWRANYGYELTTAARRHRDDYLASEAGRAHVRAVVETKLRAAGRSPDEIDAMSEDETIDAASGFFGGGHDVIIARRHYVDGAADDHRLASAGTLTLDEHHAFIAFTAEAARALYEANRDVRYVSVFQNWLKPAGASFDHLHKQLVAIDERGAQNEAVLARLRADPNVFNEDAVNYAARHSLVIAENEHAVMLAGFGTATRPSRCTPRARSRIRGPRRPRSCAACPTCSTPPTPRPARTCPATRSGTPARPTSRPACRGGCASSGVSPRWPASRARRRSTSTRSARTACETAWWTGSSPSGPRGRWRRTC